MREMKILGKNRWTHSNARERIPRSSKKAGAIFNEYIKLGPTSVPKTVNKSSTNASSQLASVNVNSAKQGSQNSVKLGRPSTLDRKTSRPSTSSTSSTTTFYTSTSESDNESPKKSKAIKNNFKQGPGRIPRSEIIQESSSSSSSEFSVEHVPVVNAASKGQSWTITELRMSDIDNWQQELRQLRELVKQRYDTQKQVQDLEEKIVKLEAVNMKLINENESLVQTVKHLVGEKSVQPPSQFVQAITPMKEENDDDCICID